MIDKILHGDLMGNAPQTGVKDDPKKGGDRWTQTAERTNDANLESTFVGDLKALKELGPPESIDKLKSATEGLTVLSPAEALSAPVSGIPSLGEFFTAALEKVGDALGTIDRAHLIQNSMSNEGEEESAHESKPDSVPLAVPQKNDKGLDTGWTWKIIANPDK